MKTTTSLKDSAKLERFNMTFTNATSDAEIAEALSKVGLSEESIEEGKALLMASRNAYETSNSRRKKRAIAYREFNTQKKALNTLHSKHRKIAKMVFEDDPIVYEGLGLDGKYKVLYVDWIEMLKTFYNKLEEDNGIKEKLVVLKITLEELDVAIAAIVPLEKARANYMLEKGASQVSTNAKSTAFKNMDKWMKRFFVLAKVAFSEQPQHLESFGITVKN